MDNVAVLAKAPNLTAPYADLIGKAFALGGRGPELYDCYGLAVEMMKRCGVELPPYPSPDAMEKISQSITNMMPFWTECEPGPGAIATIRTGRYIGHVGVVLPNEMIIHSWDRAGGVCVEPISVWKHRITGYYRFDK